MNYVLIYYNFFEFVDNFNKVNEYLGKFSLGNNKFLRNNICFKIAVSEKSSFDSRTKKAVVDFFSIVIQEKGK